jgi:hypothetical protein
MRHTQTDNKTVHAQHTTRRYSGDRIHLDLLNATIYHSNKIAQYKYTPDQRQFTNNCKATANCMYKCCKMQIVSMIRVLYSMVV